jgi:SagB-type dehydrogenase family enzyme
MKKLFSKISRPFYRTIIFSLSLFYLLSCAGKNTMPFKNSATSGQEFKTIELLKPQTHGGKRLMQALKDRKTIRSFSEKKLPPQMLSNLLWAAFGINRSESGKRTAPSAVNYQEIDIYVATEEGLYLYDSKTHMLNPVIAEDIRDKTTTLIQPKRKSIKNVPVTLIYVADYSRFGMLMKKEADRDLYSAADTGFISQNVYLFCASYGLGTVVRGLVNRPDLSKVMGLRPEQKIILVQSVGYPKE